MGAQNIRDLVARCYEGLGPLLSPNSLDQLNPNVPTGGSGSGIAPTPDPSAVIRELVGRCYDGTPPLMTNPLDQQNPQPLFVPQPDEPVPTPAEVIQTLVGRCYPDLPDLEPPPPDLDDGGDWTIIDLTDQMDWARQFVINLLLKHLTLMTLLVLFNGMVVSVKRY